MSLKTIKEELEERAALVNGHDVITIDHLKRGAEALGKQQAKIEKLQVENDMLRNRIAESDMDCIYCKLPKADMSRCTHGFPGCSRADDLAFPY